MNQRNKQDPADTQTLLYLWRKLKKDFSDKLQLLSDHAVLKTGAQSISGKKTFLDAIYSDRYQLSQAGTLYTSYGNPSLDEAALDPSTLSNKFHYYDISLVTVYGSNQPEAGWKSLDGWEEVSVRDADKRRMLGGNRLNASLSLSFQDYKKYMVEISAGSNYFWLSELLITGSATRNDISFAAGAIDSFNNRSVTLCNLQAHSKKNEFVARVSHPNLMFQESAGSGRYDKIRYQWNCDLMSEEGSIYQILRLVRLMHFGTYPQNLRYTEPMSLDENGTLFLRQGKVTLETPQTITGDLDLTTKQYVDTLISGSTVWVHHTAGTAGTAGYFKLGSIMINSPRANAPFRLTICQRRRMSDLTICFQNVDDPDPMYFTYTGTADAFLVKESASQWGLYVLKSEIYDEVSVTRIDKPHYLRNSVTFSWTSGTQVNSLEELGEYIKAVKE